MCGGLEPSLLEGPLNENQNLFTQTTQKILQFLSTDGGGGGEPGEWRMLKNIKFFKQFGASRFHDDHFFYSLIYGGIVCWLDLG